MSDLGETYNLQEASDRIDELYLKLRDLECLLSDLLSDRGEDDLVESELNKALNIIRRG